MSTTSTGMLSVTDLSTYLYCARKIYLKKVLKLVEPVKDVMVLGTVRHKAFEDINAVEEQLAKATAPDLDPEDILTSYKKEYAKILRNAVIQSKSQLDQFQIALEDAFTRAWPSVIAEANARSKNLIQFMQQHQVYGEQLWEQLTPKIQAELRIESPALALKGIIDQIEIHQTHLVPIELKTGKMPATGVWPGHRAQIGAYMVLAEEALGKPVKEGKVRYLDAGEDRHIPANPFVKIEVTGLIGKVKTIIADQQLPPKLTAESKCSPCGLREQCFNDVLMAEKQRALKA